MRRVGTRVRMVHGPNQRTSTTGWRSSATRSIARAINYDQKYDDAVRVLLRSWRNRRAIVENVNVKCWEPFMIMTGPRAHIRSTSFAIVCIRVCVLGQNQTRSSSTRKRIATTSVNREHNAWRIRRRRRPTNSPLRVVHIHRVYLKIYG